MKTITYGVFVFPEMNEVGKVKLGEKRQQLWDLENENCRIPDARKILSRETIKRLGIKSETPIILSEIL